MVVGEDGRGWLAYSSHSRRLERGRFHARTDRVTAAEAIGRACGLEPIAGARRVGFGDTPAVGADYVGVA